MPDGETTSSSATAPDTATAQTDTATDPGPTPGLADVHVPGQPPGGRVDDGPVHMPVPTEKKRGRS